MVHPDARISCYNTHPQKGKQNKTVPIIEKRGEWHRCISHCIFFLYSYSLFSCCCYPLKTLHPCFLLSWFAEPALEHKISIERCLLRMISWTSKRGLVFFWFECKTTVFKLDDIIAPPPSRSMESRNVFWRIKEVDISKHKSMAVSECNDLRSWCLKTRKYYDK